MLSTFVMSSFWHGIELGYHLFFFALFINALAAKLIEKTKLAKAIVNLVPWKILIVPLILWN